MRHDAGLRAANSSNTMKSIGSFLLIIGLVATGLKLFGGSYELRLLGWIDNWGDNVAWGIRAGFIIVGGLLMLLGGKKSKS